jgi:probable rRNA maturation factor
LGEIAIARAIARKQARHLGHAEATELKILALHGLLHLLGYDHEIDQGEMAALEDRLRRRAGLPRGLIERSHRAVR